MKLPDWWPEDSPPEPPGLLSVVPNNYLIKLMNLVMDHVSMSSGYLDDEEVYVLRYVAETIREDPNKYTPETFRCKWTGEHNWFDTNIFRGPDHRNKQQYRMCGMWNPDELRTDEEQVNYLLRQANSFVVQYFREKKTGGFIATTGIHSRNPDRRLKEIKGKINDLLVHIRELGYEVDDVNLPD